MSPVASPELPRAPRRDRAATRAAITRASVGRRGRAVHMRQTAQTVKLRRHVVLPRAAAGLIVPGVDVRPRRKERPVTPPKASPTPRVGRVPRGPIEGPRDRELIHTLVVPDHDDLALRLADRIVEIIARETAAKGRCVLGVATSGHIGFNEPGSSPDERTRLVTLDTVTRKDASADFFGEDNVPREAITMGIATILEAREIALIATGEHKADIVARAVEGEVSQDVAATFLQRHANATAYLDLAAAAELTRIKTPWVLGPVEWTPELTERAVVWLAEQTGKAILKLTARDYTEHHLSPLLSKYGAAGPINGAIFNSLRDKIRGRRKLPTRKSVVLFFPHPDDDVISMGGLLRKLWENENATVVAYMTSGNIAVFDHDVRRHLDFVERAATTLGLEPAAAQRVRGEVEASFERKAPGDVDLPAVQDLKRVIRESEAVAALESVGLPPTAARFLNLPFYRTGQVRKDPIGPEDVAIVRALLVEARPDLVFVAGDLSDPHGTHRMCQAAVAAALAQYDAEPPEVWLYRGAWQEWPLTEADVLVPLSQDELRAKILAIFKHQSQKDTAPFPGGHDEREFWQRVEARNLETAARADRLGLPEYFAMEAYRILTPKEAER